jgi:tRNA1(Val) A37 N6-methylase TrmN6
MKNLDADYPLQGSSLDLPLSEVLSYSEKDRAKYISKFLIALGKKIDANEMALKKKISMQTEMRDLRRLVRSPFDRYLLTEDKTRKRNILGFGSYGSTHTEYSRKLMWRMATKKGNLSSLIQNRDSKLALEIDKILDIRITNKNMFHNFKRTTVQNLLSYLQFIYSVGTAFPPFHARFFAEKFLPTEGDCLVIDPCAGWGGRLLGTQLVNRSSRVRYVATDPEKRLKEAHSGLQHRIDKYLNRDIQGKRSSKVFYQPFERWIHTPSAQRLMSTADLVFTSPPYFSAEVYNPENKKQSANSYVTYEQWREEFYRVLVQGAYDLLKPGGVFVLNIANVSSAKHLERDARVLAKEIGFINAGFYKLAMSVAPGTRTTVKHSIKVDGKLFKYEPCFCFRKPKN